MSQLKGTEDLRAFNQTWAPHSGSPKVFPLQLAVTINSELERLMVYAVHLDNCARFELLDDTGYCSCGLADLQAYVRRLAPHRYNADGTLKDEYLPKP